MEGHIADILKTRGPKLTQIKLEVTVNRVMLPEIQIVMNKEICLVKVVFIYV